MTFCGNGRLATWAATAGLSLVLSACSEGRLARFGLSYLSSVSVVTVQQGDTELIIDWLPSSGASTYTIEYGTAPGVYGMSAGPITAPPLTLTGLSNFTPYYFVVRSTSASGKTEVSAEYSSTPLPMVPNLAFSPLTHDFGVGLIGANSATQTLTLSNLGIAAATGCSAAVLGGTNPGDFAILSDGCGTADVAPLSTCQIQVRATATAVGLRSATLSRVCAVGGMVQTTANGLQTTGIAPNLAWTPLSHAFGSALIGSSTSAQTFTLTNSGTAAASGCSAPTLGGTNPGDFALSNNTCGTGVAVSGTCTVDVTASPTALGARTATLSQTCTVGGTTTTTANAITVTGTQPNLAWSPLTHGFGSVLTSTTSTAQTFTLTNSGTASATGCSAPVLGGANPTEFTLSANTCGATLAGSGGTCTINVAASPTTTGAKTAHLTQTCTVGGTVTTTTNAITVTGVTTGLSWSPLSNAFGNVQIGTSSTTQTFTLTNTGGASATGCSAPTLTGTNPGEFTLSANTCGATLAGSGGTCTINVSASPTTTGAKTATLTQTCTVGGTTTTTTNAITATGTNPSLAWSPLMRDFGSVLTGSTSTAQTFTLTNSGTAPATGCSAPVLGGANPGEFTLTGNTCGATVAASGGTCTINVAASPTSNGAKTATLSQTCTVGGTTTTTANLIQVTGISPGLAWTPMSNAFGNVLVGTSTSAVLFTLNNSGGAPATGCSAPTLTGANPTEFTLSSDTCGTTDLAGSGSCTIQVHANPTSVGTKTATLSRTCTVGGTSATTANAITVVGSVPTLAWTPLTNAFGNVMVGSTSSTQTFTLTNSGGVPATGCSAPTLTGANAGEFTLSGNTCGATIAASGGTCTINVAASPTSTGAKTAHLTQTCTVGGTNTTTANSITTTGVSVILAWSPLTNAFGNVQVGATSATQTFTLTNTGTANATGCSAPTLAGANPGEFTLSGNTCGATVTASGGTCTINVAASPTSTGAKTAHLTQTCTVGGTNVTTANAITTTGVTPSLAWTPLTNAFGNVLVGSTSSTQTFTLTNSGTGAATGCSAPTLAGANPGEFTLSGNTCGATVAASGGTCTINVAASPTSTGVKTAHLTQTCTVGGTNVTTANAITTTGITPSLAWSPLSNGFGNVLVGSTSSTQTFTLTNSGTANATGCSAPTLAGANAGEFTLSGNTCGATIAASGGTCTINVAASPTSTGAKTAHLTQTCTVGGTNTTTVNAITTTGTAPSLAWSPLTHGFGNILVGSSSSTQTFTLTNSGTANATGCSAPTLAGANAGEFTLSGNTCGATVNASSTCTINVAASPTSTGAKTAHLTHTCTVGGTNTTTTNSITTTGVSVNLAWTPLTQAFGNVQVGATSATQTFTLTNSGTSTATGCSAPTLAGANPGEFTLSGNTCGATVAASGGTCTINVAASPTSTGAKTAHLTQTCTVGGTNTTTANSITTTGVAPSLAFSPLTHGFGNIAVGSSSGTTTFTVTNSGTGAATGCSAPTLAGANSGEFTLSGNTCGATIAASGGTCTINVAASPTSTGAKTAHLTQTCTVGGTITTTANSITTTGIAPSLAWTPLTHAFGNAQVGSTSTGQTFTLTNSGGANATGCSAPTLAGANPGEFTLSGNTCGATVASSGGTCTITVSASPTSTGAKTAHLTQTCTVGGTNTTTANSITTTGVTPSLAWTPLTHAFGNVNNGSTSSAVTFTLTNSGTGAATGCGAPTLAGTNSGEFTLSNNTCGATVAASGGTCTIDVAASPASLGAKTAHLTQTCTVGGTNTTTANSITATSIVPNDPPTISAVADQTITNGWSAVSVNVTVGDTESGAAAVTLTAAASNTTLIPANQISVTGSGATRNIRVGSAPGMTGTTNVTLSAGDGVNTTQEVFQVTVNPAPAAPLLDGIANATVVNGGSLYLGGNFSAHRPEWAKTLMALDPATGDQMIDFMGGVTRSFPAGTIIDVALSGAYVYVVGSFTAYRGIPVESIAKIELATGNLDMTFSQPTGFNSNADSVVVSGGSVYVGGAFTTYRGATANYLVKLDATTGNLDTTFTQATGPSASVNSIVASGTSLYVAGTFTTYRGTAAERIMKVDLTTGNLDTTFTQATGAGNNVFDLVVSGGYVYMIGAFATYRGATVQRIAKIDATNGNLDTTFTQTTGLNNNGQAIAINGSDLYVGGTFNQYRGSAVPSLIKIDTVNGNVDTTFTQATGFDNLIIGLTVHGGALYVAGNFQTYRGTFKARRIAKVDLASGNLDTTFTQATGIQVATGGGVNGVKSIGSYVFAFGSFHTWRGTEARGIAKVSATTGALDTTFTQANGVTDTGGLPVVSALVYDNGSLYVGGNFNTYRGTTVRSILKLDPSNGNLDTTFTQSPSLNGLVNALVSDGTNLYIGGNFSSYRGTTVQRLIKVDLTSGVLDTTFSQTTGPANTVNALALGGPGLIVGGAFTTYRGTAANYLAAVNTTNGNLDTTFTQATGFNTNVNVIRVNGSNVYVGGNFIAYRGAQARYLAKLDATSGNLDTTFTQTTAFDARVNGLALSGGYLYAGGMFTQYRGTATERVTKLDAVNGAKDTTFSQSTGIGDAPSSTGVQNLEVIGSNLMIMGDFRFYRVNTFGMFLMGVDTTTGNPVAF